MRVLIIGITQGSNTPSTNIAHLHTEDKRVLESLRPAIKCSNLEVTHLTSHDSWARSTYMAQSMSASGIKHKTKISFMVGEKVGNVVGKENQAGKEDECTG